MRGAQRGERSGAERGGEEGEGRGAERGRGWGGGTHREHGQEHGALLRGGRSLPWVGEAGALAGRRLGRVARRAARLDAHGRIERTRRISRVAERGLAAIRSHRSTTRRGGLTRRKARAAQGTGRGSGGGGEKARPPSPRWKERAAQGLSAAASPARRRNRSRSEQNSRPLPRGAILGSARGRAGRARQCARAGSGSGGARFPPGAPCARSAPRNARGKADERAAGALCIQRRTRSPGAL